MNKREDITTVSIAEEKLQELLARYCPEMGIELAGVVALPCDLPHREEWLQWVREGRHGDLEYLIREPETRANPSLKNPWARSLLVMAHRYTPGWSRHDTDPVAGGHQPLDAPWTNRVSRYARGLDYHDVLLKAIKRVIRRLQDEIPGFQAFASTDTGPYLEREYAWLAGLGFLGRNHCLIHEKLGSGIFLGVALSNLAIEGYSENRPPQVQPLYGLTPRRLHPPKIAPVDLCGSCTRCLEACPTQALDLHKGLDAHRCLSTWSIEWQGRAPEGQNHEQAGLLFGCDICQSVCPWNQRAFDKAGALPRVTDAYDPLPTHSEVNLKDLEKISDEEFRRLFRKTPLWRCHPEGMRRNVARVRKNLETESNR